MNFGKLKIVSGLSRVLGLFMMVFSGSVSTTGCQPLEHGRTGIIRPVVKGVETKSGPVIIDDNAVYSGKSGTNTEKISVKGLTMDAWLQSPGHNNETGEAVPVHYIENAPVTYADGWGIAGEPKWVNEITTRFWCWNTSAAQSGLNTGLSYSETSDTRDFAFTVPVSPANRGDIVLAANQKAWTEGDTDFIDLTFHHPLANICFDLQDDFPEDVVIESITLSGICLRGDFSFTGPDTFYWRNQASPGSMSEEGLNITKAAGNISEVNFFIVPQVAGASAKISITFNNGGDAIVREHELVDTWLADHYHKYRLNVTLGPDVPITFDVALVAWGAETEKDLTELL